MATLKLTPDTAGRLILTADFAIRDEQNDARSQSLSLVSIAISLHQFARAITPQDIDLRRVNPLLRKIANAREGRVNVTVGDVVTARDLLGLGSETDSGAGGAS